MTTLASVVLMLGLATAASAAPHDKGTICVAPVPVGNSQPTSLSNPDGGGRTFNFEVRVGGQRIAVRHDHSVAISNLALAKKHTVQVLRDGKPFAAFKVSFRQHDAASLCLWFKPLYETWSVSPGGAAHGCACG